MKRPALPLISAFVLSSLLASCQAPAEVPVNKTGTDAAAAYAEWVNSDTFLQPLEYPSQVHLDYAIEMSMDMSSAGLPEPMEMDMTLNADYVVRNAHDLVLWGNLDLGAFVEGEQHRLNFDFEVGDDQDGLRLLLDDHGFFLEELGTEIPMAYSLSQDRVEALISMYGDLIEEMGALYGQSFADIYTDVEGPGDLMHPGSFMRFMANADVFIVHAWNSADGIVVVSATLDPKFMEGAFDASSLGVNPAIFNDMVFEIVADLESGVMLDYAFEMAIPIEAPLTPGSDQVIQMDMALQMRFTTIDVDPQAPRAVLPGAEDVMNLDAQFDMYMPLIQAAIDMQKQQMQQMSGEGESGEDFDF
ncbi:MAG: hypothetical protein GY879_06450 [Planctomycetes bacterium]|nr:hypothetical protein [Planctomycetota bacterium]